MNRPSNPQPGRSPAGPGPTRAPQSPSVPSQGEIVNRLDGQRGWLNELDTSLKKRSIIALILTCLAVGAGAAAIYISLTKNSDGDRIDALETRIENLEAAAGVATEEETTLPEGEEVLPETGVTLPETVVPGETTVPGETSPSVPVP